MKKYFLILFLLLSPISLPATTQQGDDNTTQEHLFIETETQAVFPGGQGALMTWIKDNLKYPENARESHIEGKVIMRLTIEKDGTVTNPRVVRGVNEELNAEALRLASIMPKWAPGKNNGMPVRTYYIVPINFRLQQQ